MNVKIKIDTCRYWRSKRRDLTLSYEMAILRTEIRDGWALVSLTSEIGPEAAEEDQASVRACETMPPGPIAWKDAQSKLEWYRFSLVVR